MNEIIEVKKSQEIIQSIEPEFNRVASHVNFEREFQFAMQLLKSGVYTDNNNKVHGGYLLNTALKHPESLKMAIMSTATIGISLNPALKHAYLVPRGGKICLDVSYMGMVHLACDSGGIKWVQASVVKENDTFTYSLGEKPVHSFSPFGDRGKVVGVYSVAKTDGDEYLCEFMTIEEVNAIRNRTDAWQKYEKKEIKSCPWATDPDEMAKKTVIKRASKLWPKTDKLSRLHMAIEKDNEANGIDFKEEAKVENATVNQIQLIRGMVEKLERTEEAFCSHLGKTFNKNISTVEDLNEKEAEVAIIQLDQFLKQKEKINENA